MLKRLVGRVNRNIILVFLLSNIIAMLSIFILPANAYQQSLLFLIALNFSFISCVLFVSIIFYDSMRYKKKSKLYQERISFIMPRRSLVNNAKMLTILPIVGFIMLFADRVFIRGIDYSQGLRHARYDWLETTGGSFFGVVGNLLVPLAYVGILILIINFNRLRGYRFWLIIAIIVSVFGHAALNGGRSNLLLAFVMIIIALILKRERFLYFKFFSIKTVLVFSICLGAFFYLVYIVESSAAMGGATLEELTQLGIYALYGVPDREFFLNEHSYLTYMFTYMFAYLYHGQWTAQVSSFLMDREGFYTLTSFPTVIMDKYGLIDLGLDQKAFSDAGAFISLPGAMYYDFGWFGVFFISFLLGCALGVVMVFIESRKPIGVFKVVFIVFILFVLILSPILPAYSFSYLMFILFSFFLLSFFLIPCFSENE